MIPSFPPLACRDDGVRPPWETLIDLLRWRAERQPDRLAYRFLRDGEADAIAIDYRELDRQARAIGVRLQKQVRTDGKRILLLFKPGLEFIAAFFGCLYSGMVAIPTYPPHPARRNRTASRLEAIIEDASPSAALTTSDLLAAVEPLFASDRSRGRAPVFTIDQLGQTEACGAGGSLAEEQSERWRHPGVQADALALLQYTSGSTGTPNGVMLSHGNLLHNSEQIRVYFEQTEESRCLSWLPPYHDMGLIGGILQPLYVGFPSTLLSPLHFLQQPVRWLRAISEGKITSSCGPNFAYDLCVEKIAPEQCIDLDLTSWTVACNGAEPVRAETLERFVAAFAPYGFRREAFYPCYGLAEATLLASGGVKKNPPVMVLVERGQLEHGRIVSAKAGSPGTQTLVGCGRTIPQQQIVIVDPEQCVQCQPEQVGEIWIRGPSVAQGYWGHPERTERTFKACLVDSKEGPFLRTGDLGFLKDGELFITGRLKDLIILDGRNHYPQDIEQTAEQSHPAIRPGCCIAFSVDDGGKEKLLLAAEIQRAYWSASPQGDDLQAIVKAIRRAVSEQHDVRVAQVLLLRPASIPKTPSGKHQRRACREAFLRGTLQQTCVPGERDRSNERQTVQGANLP